MLSVRVGSAALIGGGLLAVMAFVVPASPAMASAKSCEGGEVSEYTTCESISGGGLTIVSDTGTFELVGDEGGEVTNMHIELSGPNGVIKNCPQVANVVDGQTISCTWSPNHTETGGDYYATSWHYNGSGYTEESRALVDVHS
jgi:hypothetical protein